MHSGFFNKKTIRSFGASGGKRSRNGEKTPLTHSQRRAPAATCCGVTSKKLGKTKSARLPPQKKRPKGLFWSKWRETQSERREDSADAPAETGASRNVLRGHKQKAWQDEVCEIAATKKRPKGLLEQVAGIEPATTAWEADVLPLNYTCMLIMLAQSTNFVNKFQLCDDFYL